MGFADLESVGLCPSQNVGHFQLLQISPASHSLLSYTGIPTNDMHIKAFVIAQCIPEALNIFGFLLSFSPLFRWVISFGLSFKFTDSFLCNKSSALEPLARYFQYNYFIFNF